MAGCFGNSPYDRSIERQLDRYLDSLEDGIEVEVSECCESTFDTKNTQTICLSCGEQCTTITILKEDE